MFSEFNRRASNISREAHRKVHDILRSSTSAENFRQRELGEQPERRKNLSDLHKALADLKAWDKPIRPHEHLSYRERQVMIEEAFTETIKHYYKQELNTKNHQQTLEEEYQQRIQSLNQVRDKLKNIHLPDRQAHIDEAKEHLKQMKRIKCLRKIPKLQEERAKLRDQQNELADKQQKLNTIKEDLEIIKNNQRVRSDAETREFLTRCATIALGQAQSPEKMLQGFNELNNIFTSKIDKREKRIRKIDELLRSKAKYDIYNEKSIEYISIFKKAKQVLTKYQQLRCDIHKYEQQRKSIKEQGDRMLKELHETEKYLADLDKKRQQASSSQEDLPNSRNITPDKRSTIKKKLYELYTPEDKLFIQKQKLELACKNMKEFSQKITEEQQDENFQALADNLKQDSDQGEALIKALKDQTSFQNYNPYYSMDNQKNEQILDNFSATLLEGSCAVQTIRRALCLLNGKTNNREKVTTETNIAENTGYSAKTGIYHKEIPKGYKLSGFDYMHFEGNLTIDDIECITGNGFPVQISVSKTGIANHALLIEKVIRPKGEEGEIFVTIFDSIDRRNAMKVRDIPYRELEKVLMDNYIIPTHWQELKHTHGASSGSH